MEDRNQYESPLIKRYASKEMSYIFSDNFKFSSWRKLWVSLAESEKELGLDITDEQINEMKENIYNIDFDLAAEEEKKRRHDVMAHVHTFGAQCKKAMPIIHLGATSAYVGDNTDLIQLAEALALTKEKLVNLVADLAKFANEQKNQPTLGFTHFQAAQPTTVGKRACLWIQDLLLALDDLDERIEKLRFRGVKGTTGTQASFMELFEGDEEKVKKLDELVSQKAGFDKKYITGQTYPRLVDSQVSSTLSIIAEALSKISTDIRLLQHLKEVEEPFEKNQIGSSAMAYKRNPMRCERIGSLARFVISLSNSTSFTAATQWMERTLDDSANKRLAIPEAFLAIDAMLMIMRNVCNGLVVYPKVIEKRLNDELPFMATEAVIMKAVKNGKDRQELHEIIRVHSMEAGKQVKQLGKPNDLVERILSDERIGLTEADLEEAMDIKNYIGRAPSQVTDFINEEVRPILEMNAEILDDENPELFV